MGLRKKTLSPILPLALAAKNDLAQAKQNLADWKNVARWKQHIDQSNAHRAAAYGYLLEVPHKHPDVRLPADYADSFFLHDTSRRGAGKSKTSQQIADEIDALKTKLNQLEELFAETVARESADAEQLAAMEQKQKELATLEEQEKEIRAKKKQLEKEIEKKG